MRDEGRKGSPALHSQEDCYFVRPAALPEPDLAGQPPMRAREEPGKRGRLFQGHYYVRGGTRIP